MTLLQDALNVGTLVYARCLRRPIPWMVSIMITERCNLSCYYCYVDIARRRGERHVPPDYSREELTRIIGELWACGTRHVTLLGGEPLLRKDLEAIVDHSRTLGMYVDLFTNGILIDRQLGAIRKLNAVIVSIEGREAVHDGERGKNSFKRAIAGLPLVRELGVPLKINFTMTRNNIREIEYVAELAREFGATVTIGEATKNYQDEDVVNRNMPSAVEIRTFWQTVRDLLDGGAPILKSRNSVEQLIASAGQISQDEILMPGDPRMRRLRLFPCLFGRFVCQLSANGVFYPCSKLYGRTGESIYRHGVRGAFERMTKRVKCMSCRMSLVCNLNGFLSFDPQTLVETARSHLGNARRKMPS
jgi:MoaA/NifB/PqqE/SkfB family radical SAM enzyme